MHGRGGGVGTRRGSGCGHASKADALRRFMAMLGFGGGCHSNARYASACFMARVGCS